MIIGVDLGNYATKSSEGVSFLSAEIVDNPFFANAIGFKKVGESIWL